MKKIFSFMVVVIMMFASLTYAISGDDIKAAYDEGYDDGYNEGIGQVYNPKVPKLMIIEDKKIPKAIAGEYLNLDVTYKNDSDYIASEIKITPIFENSILKYERPIIYESTSPLRKNREAIANFNLKIDQKTKVGIYELKFKMEYRNNVGESHSSEGSLFVNVVEEKVKSIITITDVVTEPIRVVGGERFILKFNINNIGEIAASEMNVKLAELSADTFMAIDSKDSAYIGKLEAKSSHMQEFLMLASKDIKAGNNSFGVEVSYKNSDGEEEALEKTIYILDVLSENEKEDEVVSGKPKIIIESYSATPSNIVAGDKVNFTFKFKNTSKEKTISNMKITLSSENGAFMIAKGSNTFYVEKLAPQESATKNIELNVKQDLTSSSYPIDIDFDYEDGKQETYVSKEVINLPVTEYSKLVINSANVYDCMVGNQTSLSFDYINMGKAKISNLTASVEGDFTSVQSINYIGNLEAGNSDYYDIMVMPTKEGDLYGILVLSFEDSSGKKIETRKEFTSYAMGEFMPGPDDGEMLNHVISDYIDGEQKKPLTWWQITLYGFGSFLITFIITKIITQKIVRKKLEDEI